MPIGGHILTKYTREPDPPRKPFRRREALLIVLGGIMALGTAFAWALNSLLARQVFLATVIFLTAALTTIHIIRGWRENGLVGALYRAKHPLGTILAGDEERSPTSQAWLSVWLFGIVGSVALITARGWPF